MASETALFCRIIHELDDAYFQMKQKKMENEFKTDLRSFVSSPKDWPELTKFDSYLNTLFEHMWKLSAAICTSHYKTETTIETWPASTVPVFSN